MVEIPQMLDQMISPREALLIHAVAAAHRAREVGRAGAVDGGLVALEVG